MQLQDAEKISLVNTSITDPKTLTKTSKSLAQLKRGLVELSILTIINSGEYLYYAEKIRERLSETELAQPKGTLYPALKKLMKEKIIDQHYDESDLGTPRKHYFLTEKGRIYYEELDKYWSKLNQTIESLKKRPGW